MTPHPAAPYDRKPSVLRRLTGAGVNLSGHRAIEAIARGERQVQAFELDGYGVIGRSRSRCPADRACVNTLGQANDLCDALGPGVGVIVDIYHVGWDPALEREIARAGRAEAGPGTPRLMGFHLCDWLVPTTDLLLDRGMMGDGVIDIPLIRSWMERSGYRGAHEVEIFSARDWWKRNPDLVLATCKARHAGC